MTAKLRPVVVYAPPYDENSGGCVVLHALVDRLRSKGVEAYIHFYVEPTRETKVYSGRLGRIPKRWRFGLMTGMLRGWRRFFSPERRAPAVQKTSGFLDTPTPSSRKLKQAVVVYPESIDGNPLKSRRVIRWLLNAPRYINKDAHFGAQEELFYYREAFKGEYATLPTERHLYLNLIRRDCYYEPPADSPREGTCYLVRHGKKHGIAPEDLRKEGKLVIDGLSHQEIGEIFRRSRYLVCYAPNTMYLPYAVMCGCVPVLLKPPAMDDAEFAVRCSEQRVGVAMGFDDVGRAIATRGELLAQYAESDARADRHLDNFIAFIRRRFPASIWF